MVTYEETLNYLYSRLPVFQHIGPAAYKADLNNTIAICKALGNPEDRFKSVHIAGTNGKGSVSSMLAAIFTVHGYKTGLYTSPHLKDFRERIRINGNCIPGADVVDFTERHKDLIENLKPSFFEITVGMAFDYFAREHVDIAIVETGLGGRLDSTNVITPELSVVTNIGWDHMDLLGNTLGQIATEKAGIIKPGIPAVLGEWDSEILEVFQHRAYTCNTTLRLASAAPPDWEAACELKGNYQKQNLATVYCAVQSLRETGYEFEDILILNALGRIKELTGLRGRWETLGTEPQIIADTAHNADGLQLVLAQLLQIPHKQLHIVLGVVKDKDLSRVLPLFPAKARYYFAKPSVLRGMEATELMEKAAAFGLSGNAFPTVHDALLEARAVAETDDLIYIGGSTFTVADAL